MRSISPFLLTIHVIATALCPAMAGADSAGETRLREALRSATTQLRALEDERGTWQAKEAELRKELESLRKHLASAKQTPASGRSLTELKQRLAEQNEANAKLTDSLAQCQNAGRDAAENARAKEDQRARLAGEVTSLSERLDRTEAKNARMYKVGKDIIDWLSNVGMGAALLAREPFLGLKRVELENLAQDYEDKLLEQKVKP